MYKNVFKLMFTLFVGLLLVTACNKSNKDKPETTLQEYRSFVATFNGAALTATDCDTIKAGLQTWGAVSGTQQNAFLNHIAASSSVKGAATDYIGAANFFSNALVDGIFAAGNSGVVDETAANRLRGLVGDKSQFQVHTGRLKEMVDSDALFNANPTANQGMINEAGRSLLKRFVCILQSIAGAL